MQAEQERSAEVESRQASPSSSASIFGRGGDLRGNIHHQSEQHTKDRKYREEFIQYGFTCVIINERQHPQCVICTEVLAHESLKPAKMLRHLKTKHPSLAAKPSDFFRRKEREVRDQKQVLTSQTRIPAKAQRASYEVAYLIAQAKKPHTIGKTLIKPAAIAMSRAMHGDKLARELESVPLSNGTIARRITDMAQDIMCQLVDRIKGGKYALQLDESTDISTLPSCLFLSDTALTEN
nr:SCAN domain-containing protein 3-like [Lepeophtheirus salmonis]